jgi:hypothetical protein
VEGALFGIAVIKIFVSKYKIHSYWVKNYIMIVWHYGENSLMCEEAKIYLLEDTFLPCRTVALDFVFLESLSL